NAAPFRSAGPSIARRLGQGQAEQPAQEALDLALLAGVGGRSDGRLVAGRNRRRRGSGWRRRRRVADQVELLLRLRVPASPGLLLGCRPGGRRRDVPLVATVLCLEG